MTPDHEQLIANTLQLAHARAVEWLGSMAIPLGKNPPAYTLETMWNSPLGRDLVAIANYVEGYPAPQEGIPALLNRTARSLFGHTLSPQGFRLPKDFHKQPLGQLFYAAFARSIPKEQLMRTHEVQKLFGVKRQTVYDWAEDDTLIPYYIDGTMMFVRSQVEQFHTRWLRQKQQRRQRGIVTKLS